MEHRRHISSPTPYLLLRVILSCSWMGASVASAQAAPGESPYRIEGAELVAAVGASEARTTLGCNGTSFLVHGDRIYVACEREGAVVVQAEEGDLRLVGRVGSEGQIAGFFLLGGEVWATSTRTEGRPFDELPSASTAGGGVSSNPEAVAAADLPSAGEAPQPASEGPVGEVLETGPRSAVISLGSAQHLGVGDRVEVFESRDDDLGGDVSARTYERLIVAEVTAVGEGRSRIALGMNEQVPVGALVRPIHASVTRSLVAPPRASGFLELGFSARPFIPVGSSAGVGFLGELSANYRGERSWFVSTALSPVGFSFTGSDDARLLGWNVRGGFDRRLFELGLGVGLIYYANSGWGAGGDDDEQELALTLDQSVRFGARDGLHFWAVSQLILLDGGGGDSDEFEWSGMNGGFQIPVHGFTWLLLRGGGSKAGEIWGEVGLKLTVRGDGDSGTIFVAPSIGVVLLDAEETIIGPMVGLSVDWRI